MSQPYRQMETRPTRQPDFNFSERLWASGKLPQRVLWVASKLLPIIWDSEFGEVCMWIIGCATVGAIAGGLGYGSYRLLHWLFGMDVLGTTFTWFAAACVVLLAWQTYRWFGKKLRQRVAWVEADIARKLVEVKDSP